MTIETPRCPHCKDDRQAERIQGSVWWFCNCCAKEFAPAVRLDTDPETRDEDVIETGLFGEVLSARVLSSNDKIEVNH